MLNRNFIAEELNSFGDKVVKNAKENLARTNSNFTNKLTNSISHSGAKISAAGNIVSLSFDMEDWGEYQDQGVRGVGGVRKTTSKFKSTNNKGKMWKQNAPKDTPFSFNKDKPIPAIVFEDWAKKKGLSPFAVAVSVWRQGLKPKRFFTNAFEEAYETLPDEILEAFSLQVDSFLDFTRQ